MKGKVNKEQDEKIKGREGRKGSVVIIWLTLRPGTRCVSPQQVNYQPSYSLIGINHSSSSRLAMSGVCKSPYTLRRLVDQYFLSLLCKFLFLIILPTFFLLSYVFIKEVNR